MTQHEQSPVHNPLWGILLLVIILGWLTVTLYTQAAKFDSTEGKAILLFISPLVAGWCWWFFRFQQSK